MTNIIKGKRRRNLKKLTNRRAQAIKYNISVEEYNSLSESDKKGYHQVVESRCNVCNDSLDDRLIDFIRNVWTKK